MAHDFEIRALDEQGSVVNRAFFFGFAHGIAYTCFPHGTEHFAGVSGDGHGVVIPREDAVRSLEKFIETFDAMGYPDPSRADDLKAFLSWTRDEGSACQRFGTIWS